MTNPQQDAQPPNNTEAQPAEHQSDPEAAAARQRRLGEEASRIAQETGRNPVEVLEEAQGERQASEDEFEDDLDELDLDNRRPPFGEATGCLILPPGQSPQQPWFGVIEEQRTEASEAEPGPKTIEERRARAAEERRVQRNDEGQEYGGQGRGGGR